MQPTNQMRWFETISPLFDANDFSQGSFIFEVSGWTIEKHETTKQPTLQKKTKKLLYLVVSTHPKNIGQNGNLPQVGVKIKNI